MTYRYRAPTRLEEDYQNDDLTPPDEMYEELEDHVVNLEAMAEQGAPLVPVEGRVSDYKSWLAAASALSMADDGWDVAVFTPQTTNRESAVFKLRQFGASIMEHPGRIDLCIWDRWRDEVGHVDRSTCEEIGCPYYLHSDTDIQGRTEEALASPVAYGPGGRDLDAETMKNLAGSADFCPAQFYLAAREHEQTDGVIDVATYAKAFNDRDITSGPVLDADVLMLDEAHTVSAEPDVTTDEVDPAGLASAASSLASRLEGSGERWAQRAYDEVAGLADSLGHWRDLSTDQHVDPDDVFRGESVNLSDAFETIETVTSRTRQAMRRNTQSGAWNRVADLADPLVEAQALRSFLSLVRQYREGDVDFVHSLYEESGQRINEMAFRAVAGSRPEDGCTPGEVYDAWLEAGTHPAVRDRWGTILDRYIESLWDGRSVWTRSDLPGAPVMPLDRLREIAGAETVITFSATHNERSDPTRDPDRLRPTRHELLCAPVNLRSDGSDQPHYDGSESVDPHTPWFRMLVERAKEASGDSLAAVPINYANAAKWRAMPVETITNDDGDEVYGIVPNSRGSIGEKGLERMEIDTVMCGVQVQSPAPTARRLVQLWETLAPRHRDPEDALEESWRLLAQHAVSGTIQAGGRFAWDTVNLVFERPSLLRLAGFETAEATPESPGFAGAFCRLLEEERGEWVHERESVRAAKVVRYLASTDGKAASINQSVGGYKRVYDADENTARRALRRAINDGRISARETRRGLRFETT